MAMQLAVRLNDEEQALLMRRVAKLQDDAPEIKLKPGAVGRYAVQLYLSQLTEDDLAPAPEKTV